MTLRVTHRKQPVHASVSDSFFVISLDFELMWGVRDHLTKEQYGRNILGVREAIPRILAEFERRNIRATWATVGFLFCESKDELLQSMPIEAPVYLNPKLSNYSYLHEVGQNEQSDPYYFGLSLLKQVLSCPGQEIGTHTFSHFYCLEKGPTNEDFEADLHSAIAVAARRDIPLRSIAFPRNQYEAQKLAICARHGLRVYRGNEHGRFYQPAPGEQQSLLRRGFRLGDAYLNLSGDNTSGVVSEFGVRNVSSSRFLRPFSHRFAPLDVMKLLRITRSMDSACQRGTVFHLWWHPHNFGTHLAENMRFLNAILDHYAKLRDTGGMNSRAMGDFDV